MILGNHQKGVFAVQLFEIVALTTVVLFLKMFAIVVVQAYYRVSRDTYAKPEDAKVYGSGEAADAELPIVDRAQRALRNDLENIPMFLFLAWASVQMDIGTTLLASCSIAFVLTRCLHTVTYLIPTQPHRTIVYSLGLVVNFVLAGFIVSAALY